MQEGVQESKDVHVEYRQTAKMACFKNVILLNREMKDGVFVSVHIVISACLSVKDRITPLLIYSLV